MRLLNKIKRIYVEKKPELAVEANLLLKELKNFLKIKKLKSIRIIHRYDIEGVSDEIYEKAKTIVFSDPSVDLIYDEKLVIDKEDKFFVTEYLPGQYDQKADFAAQCLQALSLEERPKVKTAQLIILHGDISDDEFEKIKNYYINPVEVREAAIEKPATLVDNPVIPDQVEVLNNFIDVENVEHFLDTLSLAMTKEDLKFCQDYFKNIEKRNPTITEIRVIDTYWSDHCRHTTFNTIIDKVEIEESKYKDDIEKAFEDYKNARKYVYQDKTKEMCLMDIAQIAMKEMRKRGSLEDLEVSDEINAASIEVEIDIDGRTEKWLVMFKNETHNHPTEIEPFGGAATCLGGAIRDPLSGRSYVYGAMRITGSGDPRIPFDKTLPGKLPQRKITTTAAAGYSSYGSQIGLPAGQVAEIYHEGFVAKRMELGAVIAAAPKENVVRLKPVPGDAVILLGGRTGRDGCGGATGSSKEHDEESAVKSGAEVQKGNAAIEGYIQKLFRKPEVSKMIKKCNDFGAGGVSVAVGELADSLYIDLDKVPVKYAGLDGTELAISESQERMAVVVSADNKDDFIKHAHNENLEATEIAQVTDNGRLTMIWKGNAIVDIKREFLDSNGVRQRTDIYVEAPKEKEFFTSDASFKNNIKEKWLDNLKDLNVCSQKGLVEKFDSSAGGNTILSPFGGKYQDTPSEGLLMKLPVQRGKTNTSTAMTFGYNPYLSTWSPFHGGIYAVIQAVSKVIALGGDYKKIRLTMQEYFEKLGDDKRKWGKPFAALLGAYKVQKELDLPAIGGKDSMSGTFMDIHVPPTLVVFALDMMDARNSITPEFKNPNSDVLYLPIKKDNNHIPDFDYLRKLYSKINELVKNNSILSIATVKEGGIAAELTKMCFGNKIGMEIANNFNIDKLFEPDLGSFVIEVNNDFNIEMLNDIESILLGKTSDKKIIRIGDTHILLEEAYRSWSDTLDEIFPIGSKTKNKKPETESKGIIKEYKLRNVEKPIISVKKPKVLIPVFLGTNSEYELERAFEEAGAHTKTFIIRNITKEAIAESINELVKEIESTQIIALSGSFTGGNESFGAANFITAILKTDKVRESIEVFLKNKDGLMLGIGNGFQALLKSGLLPYGSLTVNNHGNHISTMIDTKITSILSPWFSYSDLGDIYTLPVAHREGRFVASEEIIKELEEKGQIAAQYVSYNPNGSTKSIEAITSSDGRILGKMGHSERKGQYVGTNIPGVKDQPIFKAGVDYFKI